MRFFFSSKQFKIILGSVIALIIIAALCFFIGGRMSPQADLTGTITAPFKTLGQKIGSWFSDTADAYTRGDEALIENAELESQINELREQLADYEKIKGENEFYKDYLEIKDAHPDFKFESATLISRDNHDPYKGFTINKGSINGIEKNDPVITDAGLVGFVSEVGTTTCKVSTVLSPDVVMGALDNRTNDSGVLSGSLELAQKGETKLYNLSRSCNVAVGDYVVTSGEGIFPAGLLIGTIESIDSDEYNTSIYAAVKPFCQLDELRSVMIITEFKGQGGIGEKIAKDDK